MKLSKILSMKDSRLKLLELISLNLSLGIFDKEKIIKEIHRLYDLGYTVI